MWGRSSAIGIAQVSLQPDDQPDVSDPLHRRILVADDDPFSRMLLGGALEKWGYEPVLVGDGNEAMAELDGADAPRIAILDWMMPGLDGPQICERLRLPDRDMYTYLILLTSKTDKEDVLLGLRSGADDYVQKPFDLDELRIRVRAGVRIIDLQAQLVDAREAYRRQATHDALTGITNRRAIFERLSTELSRFRRSDGALLGGSLSVLLLDIDHFKRINDTLGHAAGDAVLVEVASRMRKTLRDYDGLGRYGGEEFLIVLPDTPIDVAKLVAERVRGVIANHPVMFEGCPVPVTASIGAAPAEVGLDTSQIIARADEALYGAKAQGRDRVVLAEPLQGARIRGEARPRRESDETDDVDDGHVETPRAA